MSGLKTVLEQVAGERPADDDGQDGLFGDELPMPVTPVAAPGGAGRPKGRRNRSTEEWRKLILAKHSSPLEFLAAMWSRTPKQLAEELGLYEWVDVGEGRREQMLATGEAFKRQVEAATAALPYLHQKQPLALDLPPNTRGLLILGNLDTEGAEDVHALPLAPEQNQQVIEHEPQQSHDTQSHAKPNPLRHNDD